MYTAHPTLFPPYLTQPTALVKPTAPPVSTHGYPETVNCIYCLSDEGYLFRNNLCKCSYNFHRDCFIKFMNIQKCTYNCPLCRGIIFIPSIPYCFSEMHCVVQPVIRYNSNTDIESQQSIDVQQNIELNKNIERNRQYNINRKYIILCSVILSILIIVTVLYVAFSAAIGSWRTRGQ